MTPKTRIKASAFRPINDNVFVTDMDSGPQMTAGGIIRPDDNMTEQGIRPRWARVWAVGPDVVDITAGEWVYLEHGRWTTAIDLDLPEGVVRVWKIDWPNAVLLASPDDPREHLVIRELPKTQNVQSKHDIVRSVAPTIIRTRG